MNRVDKIKAALRDRLAPVHLEIIDESAAHAGHAGAMSGGGHFAATIVADAFEGKSPVQRHQVVYTALGSLMGTEIHAFSIHAFTPSEFQQ